jgi:Ribonuclease HII
MNLYEFDAARIPAAGLLCGVDEAGRGPLAGPVYAAAVVLPPDLRLPKLNDSKKLTAARRDALYENIIASATSWSVARAEVEEIDALNILQATFLAMCRAVEGLDLPPGLVLIDGNRAPGLACPTELVVRGDSASAAIAAASILAKVSRDRSMAELAEQYPEYEFLRHKGYGTKLHYEKLDAYGPCPAHRRTFLRKWQAARAAGASA